MPSRPVSRALQSVGLASYSLYLWHAIATLPAGAYSSPAVSLLSWLAIPLAWVSYRWVELPFVDQGRRLLARRRAGVVEPVTVFPHSNQSAAG